MKQIKVEITGKHPGLGQMLADKAMTTLNDLMRDNLVFKQDPEIIKLRSKLYIQSRRSEITVGEVKDFYENKLYPRLLAVWSEIESGRITSLPSKGLFHQLPKVKTFEEIRELLVKDLEKEAPRDAEDSAVDSVIMGDIQLSDLFLPFQEQIRERVLGILGNRIDIEEDSNSIVEELYGESIFKTLSLKDESIRELLEQGKLDKEIGEAILSTRIDIEDYFGESELNKARRIKAMKAAHLGVIDLAEDEGDEASGGISATDVKIMELFADILRDED